MATHESWQQLAWGGDWQQLVWAPGNTAVMAAMNAWRGVTWSAEGVVKLDLSTQRLAGGCV